MRLVGVRCREGHHLGGHGHDVCQIELALGVVRADLFHRREQEFLVDDVYSGVDFIYLELFTRCIVVFHNAFEIAFPVADDPAVAGWVRDSRREDAHVCAGAVVGIHEAFQGFLADERHVARQDEYVSGMRLLQGILCHEDGVACSQLGFLDHCFDMEGLKVAYDHVPSMAHHRDHTRGDAFCQAKGIVDQGISQNLVQDLGILGFQSRTFPGCKDYATSGFH